MISFCFKYDTEAKAPELVSTSGGASRNAATSVYIIGETTTTDNLTFGFFVLHHRVRQVVFTIGGIIVGAILCDVAAHVVNAHHLLIFHLWAFVPL